MALKEHGFDKNKEIYDLASIASAVKELKNMMGSIYPVGSIYLTMSYNFNPSSVFGGTWSRVSGGYFLMSTTTKNSGITTGGSNTMTLSTNNMPAHTHTTMQPNSSIKNDVTMTDLPIGWYRNGGLGPGTYQLGASSEEIFGNCDTDKRGTTNSDTGSYLFMRPQSVHASTAGNLADGRLYLVNGLKKLEARGSDRPSVSHPYEASGISTHKGTNNQARTGSLGGGKAFDNRPQYMEVYMWRRTN